MTRPNSLFRTSALAFSFLLAAFLFPVLSTATERTDLNGEWLFRIDPKVEGEKLEWNKRVPEGAEAVALDHEGDRTGVNEGDSPEDLPAAQRRDNKDPFAVSQSTESGDIFPLEHWGNPARKQLLQLIYHERKPHLRFYPSQPLRCDGSFEVLKPGRKPDNEMTKLLPGELIQHFRDPGRGTVRIFS